MKKKGRKNFCLPYALLIAFWLRIKEAIFLIDKLFNYTTYFSSTDTQVFFLMSRKRKALSINLKYMKRTINVKIIWVLFQVVLPLLQLRILTLRKKRLLLTSDLWIIISKHLFL